MVSQIHVALWVVLPAMPRGLFGFRSGEAKSTPLLATLMFAPVIFVDTVAGLVGLVAHYLTVPS